MNLPQRPTCLCAAALCLLAGTLAHAQSPTAAPRPATDRTGERRVVLVVWDGLRPDSISDETTPTLAKLAREGVFFTRHHAVYPTMTEVNGTALTTGCYPAHSGVIGNREYRPAIDPLKTVAMEDPGTIRKGDEVTGGKYLRVPTLPELLQAAGMRTVITGTKRVVLLMDRAARHGENESTGRMDGSQVLFEGKTLPQELESVLSDRMGGPFPTEIHFPNAEQDAWTTRALTQRLWHYSLAGLPKFSVLWMSDPDYTQHQFGPDSPQAHRALASVDADLAALLKALEDEGLRGSTDVLVVSDHGFSTIGRAIDVPKVLNSAGCNATREWQTPPRAGATLIDGLGGSVYVYAAEHDAETVGLLVSALQRSDFAGVIFTRDGLPGTFPLSTAHIDSPDAPDIAVAMRWTDDRSATGFPGSVVSDGGRRPGQGTHATLSRYDLHNTLIAAGPDFRVGWRDELPSGNVDVAPTIARLLGLPNPPKMDGRVLFEALVDQAGKILEPPVTTRAEVKADAGNARWSQYLQVTRYGGVDYLEEGNGSAEDKPVP